MVTLVRVDVGDIFGKNARIDVWEFVGTLVGCEVSDIIGKNVGIDVGEFVSTLVSEVDELSGNKNLNRCR